MTVVAQMSNVAEYRSTAPDIQVVRADDVDDKTQRFTGHAAVFNERTEIGNPQTYGWVEEIAPGAFDKTLQGSDARFLIDHNSSMLVARVSAGDLRLSTDGVGLAVEADMDTELSYVRDLMRHLEKRRITGMSFGFYVVRDEWAAEEMESRDGNGTVSVDVRTIQEVRLLEVSAVTFPAYDQTDAGLRCVREARGIDFPSRDGESSAPLEESTRNDDDAPAEEVTRHRVAIDRRMLELCSKRDI